MPAADYPIPNLPSHVKTILVTGAGGFLGQLVCAKLLTNYPSVELVATDVRPPPTDFANGGKERVTSLAADLGDTSSLGKLFAGRSIDAVFALHGIMSGGSEQDFELGYRVNVDSHVSLLKGVTKHHKESRPQGSPLPLYIYTSSQAVYGGPKCLPTSTVQPDDTPVLPESSYGVSKLIVELYVFDYTRKGFIDGRILRLPTVAVRSGVPSSAASSFISGLIREPLQGLRSDCPVADSLDDPNMDTLGVHITSVRTVVHNIVYALSIPGENFPAHSRSVNIPGITTTPRKILASLVKASGSESTLSLIDFQRNPQVLAITAHWPGGFEPSAALALGFARDDEATGFDAAVEEFKRELEREGKLKI